MRRSRLPRWLRLARLWDSVDLWTLLAGTAWDALTGLLPFEEAGEKKRRQAPTEKPEIVALEPRFFPGQTAGMLGVGVVGTGLTLLDREIVRSQTVPNGNVHVASAAKNGDWLRPGWPVPV